MLVLQSVHFLCSPRALGFCIMPFGIHLRILLVLAPVATWALAQGSPRVDFEALRQLDAVSSGRIESLDDATAYVRKSAALCDAADSRLVPGDLESRLAWAELDAAKDPDRLVPDHQVAEAFNFISDEFGVPHPARLTASDVLLYRGVMSAIFPHVFSPKSVSGNRPVGAMVMLYLLVYNGGITEGVRKAAQLDRPPGSLKISGGTSSGHIGLARNPNLIGREYQTARRAYFQRLSPHEIRSFVDRSAVIMALTGGR